LAYIKDKYPNLEELQKELSADEVYFVGDELRIWWD